MHTFEVTIEAKSKKKIQTKKRIISSLFIHKNIDILSQNKCCRRGETVMKKRDRVSALKQITGVVHYSDTLDTLD